MKRISSTLLLLLMVVVAMAEDVKLIGGSLSVFHEQENAFLEIDYSNTMVKDQTLSQYLKSRGADFERDWPEDKAKALEYFVVQFNRKNKKGLQVITTPGVKCKYKMVLHVTYLDMGNGASAFMPWSSAKAGGVIMNGIMDVGEMATGKAICRLASEEVKGLGHPSETVRLGMCYFEFAQRVFKEAKRNDDVLPIRDSDVDLLLGKKAAKKTTTAKKPVAKQEVANDDADEAPAKPAAKTATKTTAKKGTTTTKTTAKTGAKTTASKSAAQQKPAEEKSRSIDVPNSKVKNADWDGDVNRDGEGGSVEELRSVNKMSLYIDFAQAKYDNQSEAELIESVMNHRDSDHRNEYFDNVWKYYKAMACHTFQKTMNEIFDDNDVKVRLVRRQGEEYTLKIVIREVAGNGEITADYLVVNTQTGETVAAYFKITDGAKRGQFTDLFLVGIENAAKEIGKSMAKRLK